jgi:hypothetical protein
MRQRPEPIDAQSRPRQSISGAEPACAASTSLATAPSPPCFSYVIISKSPTIYSLFLEAIEPSRRDVCFVIFNVNCNLMGVFLRCALSKVGPSHYDISNERERNYIQVKVSTEDDFSLSRRKGKEHTRERASLEPSSNFRFHSLLDVAVQTPGYDIVSKQKRERLHVRQRMPT